MRLDCGAPADWSYRAQPPWHEPYNHEHFVANLAILMMNVDAVIWLPRARQDGHGQYQYRVWCAGHAGLRLAPPAPQDCPLS